MAKRQNRCRSGFEVRNSPSPSSSIIANTVSERRNSKRDDDAASLIPSCLGNGSSPFLQSPAQAQRLPHPGLIGGKVRGADPPFISPAQQAECIPMTNGVHGTINHKRSLDDVRLVVDRMTRGAAETHVTPPGMRPSNQWLSPDGYIHSTPNPLLLQYPSPYFLSHPFSNGLVAAAGLEHRVDHRLLLHQLISQNLQGPRMMRPAAMAVPPFLPPFRHTETVLRFPCKARSGIDSASHNSKTAYIEVPPNTPHGAPLKCCHEQCARRGNRYRYCTRCGPMDWRNFKKRHTHSNTSTASSLINGASAPIRNNEKSEAPVAPPQETDNRNRRRFIAAHFNTPPTFEGSQCSPCSPSPSAAAPHGEIKRRPTPSKKAPGSPKKRQRQKK